MLILGLDIASKTGYSFYDTKKKKVLKSGIIDLTKKRGESSGMLFLKFRTWINEVASTLSIDLVAYEQSHHRGGASTEITVNLTGRIQEICAQYNIDYTTIHSGTLKKFATGKGNADKDEMKAKASKIIGREVVDDNEADAIHISMWAEKYLKGPQIKLKTNRKKIKKGKQK